MAIVSSGSSNTADIKRHQSIKQHGNVIWDVCPSHSRSFIFAAWYSLLSCLKWFRGNYDSVYLALQGAVLLKLLWALKQVWLLSLVCLDGAQCCKVLGALNSYWAQSCSHFSQWQNSQGADLLSYNSWHWLRICPPEIRRFSTSFRIRSDDSTRYLASFRS